MDYIWLTPFYRSPQNDNGYDVADYTSIDPVFWDDG
ncbi:alpha-amylase family glycosyl hydrolase [Peribacillus frigoritolerans]|nr:alpha-amylase family glycosyl hydrolase [Peribacillus frigoritolerans]